MRLIKLLLLPKFWLSIAMSTGTLRHNLDHFLYLHLYDPSKLDENLLQVRGFERQLFEELDRISSCYLAAWVNICLPLYQMRDIIGFLLPLKWCAREKSRLIYLNESFKRRTRQDIMSLRLFILYSENQSNLYLHWWTLNSHSCPVECLVTNAMQSKYFVLQRI